MIFKFATISIYSSFKYSNTTIYSIILTFNYLSYGKESKKKFF